MCTKHHFVGSLSVFFERTLEEFNVHKNTDHRGSCGQASLRARVRGFDPVTIAGSVEEFSCQCVEPVLRVRVGLNR